MPRKGYKMPEEYKQLRSKSNKNNLNVSLGQKKRFEDKDQRELISKLTKESMNKPEVREKYLNGIKHRNDNGKFSKACSLAQKKRFENENEKLKISNKVKETMRDPEIRKKCSKGALITSENIKNNGTYIERIIEDQLKRSSYSFQAQKYVYSEKIRTGFIFDFYIPSLKLVIEADGEYWHSLPNVVSKDKIKNEFVEMTGHKILRLSESKIKSKDFDVVSEIKNYLAV